MAVQNVSVELWLGGRKLARGTCHLLVRAGPEGGTVSQLHWSEAEQDMTGRVIELRLPDGRALRVTITRHSHPEGSTVLRFRVDDAR
jgi:hypothetical protein